MEKEIVTAEELRELVELSFTTIWFVHNGVVGNIEGCYYPEKGGYIYSLVYGDKEIYLHSVDEVMKGPFLDGECLEEVVERLDDISW